MFPDLEKWIKKQTAGDLRTDAEKYPFWLFECKKYCCRKNRRELDIEEKDE